MNGPCWPSQHAEGKDYRLEVTDLAACTPRGARSVLGLMSSHRSLALEVTWYGGTDEPLHNLIAERGSQLRLEDHWMVRDARRIQAEAEDAAAAGRR